MLSGFELYPRWVPLFNLRSRSGIESHEIKTGLTNQRRLKNEY